MLFSETILLTGGSGYIGSTTLAQLLKENYTSLRATVRNSIEQSLSLATLKNSGVTDDQIKNLQFFFVDLLNDEGWMEALMGVKYVLHIASPIAVEEKNKIEIAVEGTLRVLKFSRDCGVKRVVVTSSFLTVGHSKSIPQNRLFNDTDFTPLEDAHVLGDYHRSKILSERAARKFIEEEGESMELVTIHPGRVFGPIQNICHASSIESITDLLTNKTVAFADYTGRGCISDVRDVADLHIRAISAPNLTNCRLICVSDEPLSYAQITQILHDKLPSPYAQKVNLVTKVHPEMRHGDNSPAKKLGWKPHNVEETIIDAANSLIALGLVAK